MGWPEALPKNVNPQFVQMIGGVYYDLCVICKDITGYETRRSIKKRKHYIEGCGQLCKDCYDNADFMT